MSFNICLSLEENSNLADVIQSTQILHGLFIIDYHRYPLLKISHPCFLIDSICLSSFVQ